MIDVSTDNLWQEIERAEDQRDRHMKRTRSLINAHSGDWVPDHGLGEWPEAVVHEYLSYMVPRIVSGTPRYLVHSTVGPGRFMVEQLREHLVMQVQAGFMELEEADSILEEAEGPSREAQAIQFAENFWAVVSQYKRLLDRIAYDCLLSFGAELVCLRPDPVDEDRMWPVSERIPPERVFIDSESNHWTEAKFLGHWYVGDLDELMERDEEEGWDRAALERLKKSQETESGRPDIRVYETWVRDYTEEGWDGPDEGFHGGLFTLAAIHCKKKDGGPGWISEQIRKPRPAFVPKDGPYAFYGVYEDQKGPYPISPLAATYKQQVEFQKHAEAINQSARSYKKIILVSGRNPRLASIVKNSPDSFVHVIDDGTLSEDDVITVEVGGASETQIEHYTLMKQRLDRQLGLDDAQRGIVRGQGTATEHAIADESAQTRTEYIVSKFTDGVIQAARNRASYMLVDDRIRFRLGEEASDAFNMFEPEFIGGIQGENVADAYLDRLSFEIETHSMERVSQVQHRQNMQEMVQMVMTVAELAVTMPHLNGHDILSRVGDAYNYQGLEDLIDWGELKELAGQPMPSPRVNGSGNNGDIGFEGNATSRARQIGSDAAQRARS